MKCISSVIKETEKPTWNLHAVWFPELVSAAEDVVSPMDSKQNGIQFGAQVIFIYLLNSLIVILASISVESVILK